MQIESGLQLIARLREKPHMFRSQEFLFYAGLSNKSTIEIDGNISSGKTFLLTQLIAFCIMPESYNGTKLNGSNQCAILIDNDHHFQVSKLTKIISDQVRNNVSKCGSEILFDDVKQIVAKALDNLTIIKCFNSEQLTVTFHRLESLLVDNHRLCLVAIDNLLAYYWEHRTNISVKSKDVFANYLLKRLRRHLSPFAVVVLYTRNAEHISNIADKVKLSDSEHDYRIYLRRQHDRSFLCEIRKAGQATKVIHYIITENGICWNR